MERVELLPKVIATYQAVVELFKEGADLNSMTVSEITARAGIGKGTVYEYFSNKEEILAGALFYEMKDAYRILYQKMQGKETLYERLNAVLEEMEKHVQETGCSFKVLHLMMYNSQVSRQLRKLFRERREDEKLIFDLIREMITDELGEKLEAEDLSYFVMDIISRMMCFAMYLSLDVSERVPDSVTMRQRLCRDICKEIEGCK